MCIVWYNVHLYFEIVIYNTVSDWLEEHFWPVCVFCADDKPACETACTSYGGTYITPTNVSFTYLPSFYFIFICYRDYFMVSLVSWDSDTNTWNVEEHVG